MKPPFPFLYNFRAPSLCSKHERLVPDIGSKSHFPVSPLQSRNTLVPEPFPEKLRMRPLRLIGCPESAFEIWTFKFSKRLRRLFRSGEKIQRIQTIQSIRFCGPIPSNFAIRQDKGRQVSTRRKGYSISLINSISRSVNFRQPRH